MTVQQYLNENPTALSDITSINSIFESFGIQVNEVIKGSQIVRYKLNLPLDVKFQGKIRRAEKDIEYALSSALKCDEVVYGKSQDYVYVERKADKFDAVRADLLVPNMPKSGLLLLLGKDIDGRPTYFDLAKAPHVLVAGTTGSGKSELLHTFLASLIYRRSIGIKVWTVVIDPKRAEYSVYKNRNGIDLVTDMSDAVDKLRQYCDLMEERYAMLEKSGCKDIKQLNDPSVTPIVIIVDELKDLLMQDKNAEKYIVRLAQKARACGIHLILGTQSPRADVITGLIKANVPTKIALHTTNQLESRIILDQNGAEHLFGKGDMLFLGNGKFNPVRIQAAYTDEKSKQNLANALSYSEPSKVEKAPDELTYDEYLKKYLPDVDPHIFDKYRKEREESQKRPQTKKKQKRVGLIRGLINLMKVKPIMFQTDDYPPRI